MEVDVFERSARQSSGVSMFTSVTSAEVLTAVLSNAEGKPVPRWELSWEGHTQGSLFQSQVLTGPPATCSEPAQLCCTENLPHFGTHMLTVMMTAVRSLLVP